jgi:hypothetical protein
MRCFFCKCYGHSKWDCNNEYVVSIQVEKMAVIGRIYDDAVNNGVSSDTFINRVRRELMANSTIIELQMLIAHYKRETRITLLHDSRSTKSILINRVIQYVNSTLNVTRLNDLLLLSQSSENMSSRNTPSNTSVAGPTQIQVEANQLQPVQPITIDLTEPVQNENVNTTPPSAQPVDFLAMLPPATVSVVGNSSPRIRVTHTQNVNLPSQPSNDNMQNLTVRSGDSPSMYFSALRTITTGGSATAPPQSRPHAELRPRNTTVPPPPTLRYRPPWNDVPTPPPRTKITYNVLKFDEKCNEEDCPICYEKMEDLTFVKLNCSHQFCKPCIKRHLSINKHFCPMCRGTITEIYTQNPIVKLSI